MSEWRPYCIAFSVLDSVCEWDIETLVKWAAERERWMKRPLWKRAWDFLIDAPAPPFLTEKEMHRVRMHQFKMAAGQAKKAIAEGLFK